MERHRRGGFGAAQMPGRNHGGGIEKAGENRQQHRGVKAVGARAQHQQGSGKATDKRHPADAGHTFAQKGDGQAGDEQRRSEVKRDRRGDRQARQPKVIAAIGEKVHAAARQHAPKARRVQAAKAPVVINDGKQKRDGRQTANHHRLIQRIGTGQQFQDQVLKGKDRDSSAEKEDAANILAHCLLPCLWAFHHRLKGQAAVRRCRGDLR